MYDIIYIGGGLNYAGAIVASKNGKKVALVEQDLSQLGGVCLQKGCIPSKMFLHYASLVYESDNSVLQGRLSLDMPILFEKKDALLKSVTKIVQKQCEQMKLLEGKAKVVAPHKVEVNGEIYEAEHIVMGTGSSPYIPEGITTNSTDIIVSDDVLMMQKLPEEIAVYGSGAIGLEMATFFALSGSRVTLIVRKDRLLPTAHSSIQKALQTQLEKLGISLLYEHAVATAKSTKKGVSVSFTNGEALMTPLLLVATGRRPNTDVVACSEIEASKGIITDSFFETTLAKHYAIGDCNGKVQLAHAARAEALNVTQQILGQNPRPLNLEHVVKFIHTLPMSYATVGKSRKMLEQEEIVFKESLVTLNQFTYSVYNHATKGMMISYADEEGFILGAEIFAPNAEESIATVAMALAGEMDTAEAKRTIMAHPTFSEALERTFYKL